MKTKTIFLLLAPILLVPDCSKIRKLFREGPSVPRHLPAHQKTARKPGGLIIAYIDTIRFQVLDKENHPLKVADGSPLQVEMRQKEERLRRLMQDFDRELAQATQTKKPLSDAHKEARFKALCTKSKAFDGEFELMLSTVVSVEYLIIYQYPSKVVKGNWIVGASARQSKSAKVKIPPITIQR